MGTATLLRVEMWRPVAGYEERYEVSAEGEVRSRRTGQVLRQHLDKDGYRIVSLWLPGRQKLSKVHRLILEAFVGPAPSRAAQTRHLDGDPGNNALSNLAWGTAIENMQDRLRHGHHPMASKTFCAHGHPLTGDNVRVTATQRVCKACGREKTRRYRQRLSAERVDQVG